MRILVVGSGGREHALCWKLAQSPQAEEILCAPGNAGIAQVARCENVAATDVAGLVALAQRERIDLVVVGPEAPLAAGLVDALDAAGITAFGPTAKAARLESSKRFAKDFMQRWNIPTAAYWSGADRDEALAEVARRNGPCVVKADGLAAGKGVLLCRDAQEATQAVRSILDDNAFGEAGGSVVIEDFLTGQEASILAICDGTRHITLVPAQDHKAAFDGDTGPNTGGMGAYCPAPVVTDALRDRIIAEVIEPTLRGMAIEGTPFRGVLYAGLMIDGDAINVLEFNVRFGDPECQPVMTLLEGDLAQALYQAARGDLRGVDLSFSQRHALCVVMASGGYPGPYEKGHPISGLDAAAAMDDVIVFHAGTGRDDAGRIIATGGRVLGVTATGDTLRQARDKAYAACAAISWEKARYRSDIGHRAL